MNSIYQRLIALFLTTILLTGCFGPESPQEVTREFWEAVITHNTEDVLENSTLIDLNRYNAFNRKWEGYQVVTGKLMIDANQAEVETKLSQINKTGEHNIKVTTYLIKQDKKWKVDYVRTAKLLEGDVFGQFLGQLDQLSKNISSALNESSKKFSIEMQRLEDELKLFAQSTSDEANKILEHHGDKLKQRLKELAESIDRALKEHEDTLTDDEKSTLLKVSDDLEKNQQTLSEPTVNNINQSNRHIINVQQQLNKINNEKIADYKKQWNKWQDSFEAEVQALLDDLSKQTVNNN